MCLVYMSSMARQIMTHQIGDNPMAIACKNYPTRKVEINIPKSSMSVEEARETWWDFASSTMAGIAVLY